MWRVGGACNALKPFGRVGNGAESYDKSSRKLAVSLIKKTAGVELSTETLVSEEKRSSLRLFRHDQTASERYMPVRTVRGSFIKIESLEFTTVTAYKHLDRLF